MVLGMIPALLTTAATQEEAAKAGSLLHLAEDALKVKARSMLHLAAKTLKGAGDHAQC